jgi:hypothetical protein
VPTLYDLLGPASDRPKKFFIGRKLFDTERVGYSQEPLEGGGFWFDTSIPGNHNTGHEFRDGYVPWNPASPQPSYGVIGPAFSPDDRMAIIEYLKIHDDVADAVADHEKVNGAGVKACPAEGAGKQI